MDFEFSPIPINPYAEQTLTDSEDMEDFCLFRGVFTNSMQIAKYYTRCTLPEGYAYFMKIGPKAENGEWTELVFHRSLAMWMLSTAIFMPLVGILYGVLLYLGHCGSPFSSERPFQRYWRFILYIIMFSTILYTIPGLYSAFIGITIAMSTKVSTTPAMGLDVFLESSIEQVKFLFGTNKQEMSTKAKAVITSFCLEWCSKARREEGKMRPKTNAVSEYLDKLKVYHEDRIKFTETHYRDMIFIRDIQRQYFRIYADHFAHSNLTLDIWKKLQFGERIENYFSPRLYFNYEEALPHLEALSEIGKQRLNEIEKEYDSIVNRACNTISTYGTNIEAALARYLGDLESFGISIIHNLRDVLDSPSLHSSSEPFSMPSYILIVNFFVCVVLTAILLAFMLGLVVGVLGSRGPRDSFGFNKTTAAKILTLVTMVTCAAYTLCAFAACGLYLWALVVQNGICNIDEGSKINSGNLTILHSCAVPNTVYTQLIRSGLLQPIPLMEDFTPESTKDFYNQWVELSQFPPTTELKKKFLKKATECDAVWPQDQVLGFLSSLVPAVYSIENKEYVAYPAVPPSHSYYEYQLYGKFYFPIRKCLMALKPMFKKDLLANYSGDFWDTWKSVFTNFSRDFDTGLNNSLIVAEEKAFNFTFYSNNDFRDRLAKQMASRMNRLARKFNTWVEQALKTEIGQCGHVMDIFRITVIKTCKCMVDPLNGGWTGIFWVMFCIPVLLVTAIALSNNLKKKSWDYTPLGNQKSLHLGVTNRRNKVDK